MRVRGLKFEILSLCGVELPVAPHAGTWIEIDLLMQIGQLRHLVAPHAGAWIEIHFFPDLRLRHIVAPHAGAWIEIFFAASVSLILSSRTPCGCVD